MEIKFWTKTSWALLPFKPCAAPEDAPPEGFRWLRRTTPQFWEQPWRLAQEIGWLIPAPATVRMEPISDLDVALPTAEEALFSQATDLHEHYRIGWEQGPTGGRERYIVSAQPSWPRQLSVDIDGKDYPMFYPLGDGFFEWRMGWGIEIPSECLLMVMPLADLPDLEVARAALPSASLPAMNNDMGMIVACRARRPLQIERGQPIARILALHPETQRARAGTREATES